MKRYAQHVAALLAAGSALVFSPLATASTTYGFYNITHNSAGAEADGEANLAVEVIDLGGGQVQFKFTNNSTSSLTDIYFDDGTLLAIDSISDSGAGVSFNQYAAPGNLPGANNVSPAFVTSQGFSADSNPPTSPMGVSQGEWVSITFNLLNSQTYANTLAALSLNPNDGIDDLRIGVHVQSYAGGASESFVNIPTPIPEPEMYAMLLAGLGLVGWATRRHRYC